MRLKDKVAIITGGAKGIGRAACLRLAKEGAAVIVADVSNETENVIKEIKAFGGKAAFFVVDVSDKEKVFDLVDFAVKKFGRLDIMIANAGICPFKEFLAIDEQLLDRVIGINQKGAFFCAQAAMKKMVELKISGRIIFTSSISSIFGGELQAHYCLTKAAINHLMKSIAIAAGKYGITANAVLPGTVITDINRQQLENDNPELKQYFIMRTPIGRLATPDDIAAAMLFFASDDAAAVSGATLVVDGGMSINLQ